MGSIGVQRCHPLPVGHPLRSTPTPSWDTNLHTGVSRSKKWAVRGWCNRRCHRAPRKKRSNLHISTLYGTANWAPLTTKRESTFTFPPDTFHRPAGRVQRCQTAPIPSTKKSQFIAISLQFDEIRWNSMKFDEIWWNLMKFDGRESKCRFKDVNLTRYANEAATLFRSAPFAPAPPAPPVSVSAN